VLGLHPEATEIRDAGVRDRVIRQGGHERDVDGDFFVDVAAQDATFIAEVPEPRRAAVLARARALAPRCTVGWRVCEFVRR
jgi:hypothetical protein